MGKVRSEPALFKNLARKLASLIISIAFVTYFIGQKPASAPVMAMPKAEGYNPAMEILTEMERRWTKQAQDKLNEMAHKARELAARSFVHARK